MMIMRVLQKAERERKSPIFEFCFKFQSNDSTSWINQSVPQFFSLPESETCGPMTFKNSSKDNDSDTDTNTDTNTDRKLPGLMERRRHNASSNDDISDESYVYSGNKPQ